jgi:hypothetical protein
MRRRCAFVLALTAVCSCGRKVPLPDEIPHRYSLAGVVVRLDPQAKVVTIKHGDIKDDKGGLWCEAMTMEFPVREGRDFAKLQVGQQIRGTVYQLESNSDDWIAGIEIDQDLKIEGIAQ